MNRTKMPRRLAAVLAAAFMFGCVAAPAATAADPVEIVYATFLASNNHTDPRAVAQTQMIATFEKEHPDIRIRVEIDSNQQATLRALRSGADTPDVFRVNNFNAPQMVATGNVLPLDDLIRRDKVDMKDYLLPIDKMQINGKFYGMQQDFRIPILMYRKSLLKKAGVTPPRTWAEVCTVGGKLTALGGNVVGYAVPLGTGDSLGGAQALGEFMLSSMTTEDTGKYFAADDKTLAVSHGTLVKALQTIKDLYGKCKATPKISVQFGYNEVQDGLRAGSIAMATFGVYRFRATQQGGAGSDLGWAPPPAYKPDGKQAVYGYTVAINAKTRHKEAAWDFTKFIGSPEAQSIALRGGEVVARASVYKDPKNQAYLDTADGKRQLAWGKLIEQRGQFLTYSVDLTGFYRALADATQRMVLMGESADKAASQIESEYNTALARDTR
ncbi:MAG: ABC transporter substrate-binding protein [Acetobacteraceae bacterium]